MGCFPKPDNYSINFHLIFRSFKPLIQFGMQQHLHIDNRELVVTFNKEAACWLTTLSIDGRDVEIEIDLKFHHETEVDWKHFSRFIELIGKPGYITGLVTRSMPLVTELGKAFSSQGAGDHKDWKMVFNQSLYYKGKPADGISSDGLSYALIFNYVLEKKGYMDGDSYGLYLVEVEDIHITGVKRYQC